MNWFKEDGYNVAQLIYDKLVEKGELNTCEILDIYDSYEHNVFRKTEWFIYEALNKKGDVERFRDEKGFPCLKIKR